MSAIFHENQDLRFLRDHNKRTNQQATNKLGWSQYTPAEVSKYLHQQWLLSLYVMPSTQRRRRRDSTVESRRVGVGGVNRIRN